MRTALPLAMTSLAALALAGCARPESNETPPPPSAPTASTDQCGAGKLGSYLNLMPTSDVMAGIRSAIGHENIRVIRPGDAVTMDFRPDRLNIEIGEDGRIKRFHCT